MPWNKSVKVEGSRMQVTLSNGTESYTLSFLTKTPMNDIKHAFRDRILMDREAKDKAAKIENKLKFGNFDQFLSRPTKR